MGKWKAIVSNLKDEKKDVTFELFDLENDLQELTNVADQNPDVVSKIKSILKEAHVESEIPRFKMEPLGDTIEK